MPASEPEFDEEVRGSVKVLLAATSLEMAANILAGKPKLCSPLIIDYILRESERGSDNQQTDSMVDPLKIVGLLLGYEAAVDPMPTAAALRRMLEGVSQLS
jgi:hypothetical protein